MSQSKVSNMISVKVTPLTGPNVHSADDTLLGIVWGITLYRWYGELDLNQFVSLRHGSLNTDADGNLIATVTGTPTEHKKVKLAASYKEATRGF